ncbi:RNA polymerase sigma factor [Pelagibacterium luteolum]|uniref:RNA polymerase, sigma subunit, ECF family n=1 Tax=Pelagibacterium luteolum TaxID=440168 RepID=A0A1G7YAR8_9HYPH|nr:RNA polymerase sigma factor [Pelagibacterium luteolum]SDG93426.1 RNA polymerase, sigma subunit, ECF family [Pelagibacterium luteolum]
MSGVDIDGAWREHSRRVLATLIRLLGNFDLAEEALHDAFLAAADAWPRDGLPNNPFGWLVSAGRFRAIDKLRRRVRFDAAAGELARRIEMEAEDAAGIEPEMIADDQLRLIFTCCHPDLGREAQVALTLREVRGLTTEEIARAFLTKPATLAQRIVRAKAKIREDGIPYAVPDRAELAERLDAVLAVVYLVFNEGYAAHAGETLMRADLSGEAVRLGRLLVSLLPDGEAQGLLGLMLLHESRRRARVDEAGDLVLLADQDRTIWDRDLIAEGLGLVEQAFATRQIGPYTLQAAIAAVHGRAATAEETDWGQIVSLYDVLVRAVPSPVVELNRAVAVGMAQGPEVGLGLIEGQLGRGELGGYHLAHAAKADMLRRLGRNGEARAAYGDALALCRLEPERRFLERRIAEL